SAAARAAQRLLTISRSISSGRLAGCRVTKHLRRSRRGFSRGTYRSFRISTASTSLSTQGYRLLRTAMMQRASRKLLHPSRAYVFARREDGYLAEYVTASIL